MSYDSNDISSAALCTWKEARGEGVDGMRAVLHCIVNRVGAPGFAHTLHDVIYGKNQFTSMSVPSDPEFNLDPTNDDDDDPAFIWSEAQRLATEVLNGGDIDITLAAHYYANEAHVGDGWYRKNVIDNPEHPVTVVLGNHTFRK